MIATGPPTTRSHCRTPATPARADVFHFAVARESLQSRQQFRSVRSRAASLETPKQLVAGHAARAQVEKPSYLAVDQLKNPLRIRGIQPLVISVLKSSHDHGEGNWPAAHRTWQSCDQPPPHGAMLEDAREAQHFDVLKATRRDG